MNKTNIEYADYTWNPVTGCTRGCDYCYAKKVASRFGDKEFKPTERFDRYEQPIKVKKPSVILTCSMGDILGREISRDFIGLIIATMGLASQHTFLVLSKNPERYQEFTWPENVWLGTTVTGESDQWRARVLYENHVGKNHFWLSIEPFIAPFSRGKEILWTAEWNVIGAMTGPLANKNIIDFDELDDLVRHIEVLCQKPLYMKDSLANIWPGELIRELPFKEEGEVEE